MHSLPFEPPGPIGVPSERPVRRAGLRVQLVLALGGLTLLAFVPLFLAVASLTRHTLRANREDVARALGRAVAGRLASDVAEGHDDRSLRDIAAVSLDTGRAPGGGGGPGGTGGAGGGTAFGSGEGVVAIRIDRGAGRGTIEVGPPAILDALRAVAVPGGYAGGSPGGHPGERTMRANVEGWGPTLDVEVATGPGVVQVALRVGDQASRAAPLLKLVAFYTAAFAAVLLVFAYLLLTRLIVRPIGALAEAARRIEAGTSRRIDTAPVRGGAAEVAELGGVIARTTARLVDREEALAAKVQQLEQAKAELIAARDAVVRSERLASVGRLSAGLAHEVGNPIAALLGLEDVLLSGHLDTDTRDLVMRMKRETERVHRVMRDLLDFARAGEEPTSHESGASCALREVIDEVVALVLPQRALRDIELAVEVAPGLPAARIAGSRLQQVLLNLVMNAADAIGDDAHRREEDARGGILGRVVIRAHRGDGPTLRVEVEDDGPGVLPTIREHLFEPFVTSKDIGKGTGLGLAVCRGLVEAVGGAITLEGDGPGALFVVRLPTPDAPAVPRSIAPPSLGGPVAARIDPGHSVR